MVDGILFDSKLEAGRYIELKMMQKAGIISNLRLQPEYLLIPAFKKNGKAYRKTVYRADFEYIDKNGKTIVEDTKGKETEVFRIKRKIFELKYKDLEIKEIKK